MPALVGGFGNLKFTFLLNILSDLIYSLPRIRKPAAAAAAATPKVLGSGLGIKRSFIQNKILKLNKNYCSKNTGASPNPASIQNINILRTQIGPYLAGLIEGDGTI